MRLPHKILMLIEFRQDPALHLEVAAGHLDRQAALMTFVLGDDRPCKSDFSQRFEYFRIGDRRFYKILADGAELSF